MPELSAAREEGDHVTYAKELTQLQKDHSRLGSDSHKILSRAFGNNFLELEEKDVHSLVMDLLNQSSDERTKNTLNRLATSFNEMVEKNELAHTVLPLELDNFSRHSAKGERKAENGQPHQPPIPQQGENKRPSSTGSIQQANETDAGTGNSASTGNGKGAQGAGDTANGATDGRSSGAGSGTTSRLLTIPEYFDSELRIEEDFGPLEERVSRIQKAAARQRAVNSDLMKKCSPNIKRR